MRILQKPKKVFAIFDRVIGMITLFLLTVVLILSAIAAYFVIQDTSVGSLFNLLPLLLLMITASVPMALPAMFTVSTALGAIELSKVGMLVADLRALEEAAMMEVLFFGKCLFISNSPTMIDKTGTLTESKMCVVDIFANSSLDCSVSCFDVAQAASLASTIANADPIDEACILCTDYFFQQDSKVPHLFTDIVVEEFIPFDPETHRFTESVVRDRKNDFRYRIFKGPTEDILGVCQENHTEIMDKATEYASMGLKSICVAVSGPSVKYLRAMGLLALHDPLRADSAELIRKIQIMGIKPIMLTGDSCLIAAQIASEVGMDADRMLSHFSVSDGGIQEIDGIFEYSVFSSVLPKDKSMIVEFYQQKGFVVGMYVLLIVLISNILGLVTVSMMHQQCSWQILA